MSKGGKKTDHGIWIAIHVMTSTIGIAGITTILRKTSQRMKTIGATPKILKGVDAMRITLQQTNMAASMDLAESIGNIGTNGGYDKSSDDDRHQEPRRDQQQPPRMLRRTNQDWEEQVTPGDRHTPVGAEKGESSIHCVVSQQPGQYATQCPICKGKGPAVNTITVEVQQVTTRQQTKTIDWAAQYEIRRTV